MRTVECPICRRSSDQLPPEQYQLTPASFEVVKCPSCGTYAFTGIAKPLLESLQGVDATQVAAFTREKDLRGSMAVLYYTEGEPPRLQYVASTIEGARGAFPSSPKDRLEPALVNLSCMAATPGQVVRLRYREDQPVCYAEDTDTLVYLITELEKLGYVRTSTRTNVYISLVLTPEGWVRADEIKKAIRNSA